MSMLLFGVLNGGPEVAQRLRKCACELSPKSKVTVAEHIESEGLSLVAMPMQGANLNDVSLNSAKGVTTIFAGVGRASGQTILAQDMIVRAEHADIIGHEGDYIFVTHDQTSGRFSLFTDPTGQMPVYFGKAGKQVAFGPTPKTVQNLLQTRHEIDSETMMLFLVSRYVPGERTMLSGIKKLELGNRILLNNRTAELESRCYWTPQFNHEISDQRAAADAVGSVAKQGYSAVLDEVTKTGSCYDLFLTGGQDSRSALGFGSELGVLPRRARCWGVDERQKDADPAIARSLAALSGVPFEFLPLDGAQFAGHASNWGWHSSLLSDNGNAFATAPDRFLSDDTCRFTMIGDQAFGAGGMPADRNDATQTVFRQYFQSLDLLGQTAFKKDVLEDIKILMRSRIDALLDRVQSEHPKDIQDALYIFAYYGSWLLSPSNFKMPVLPVRRPMMTKAALELIGTLDPYLRIDKFAYSEMLRQRFPQLAAHPVANTTSEINWATLAQHDEAYACLLRRTLTRERLEALPIADLLSLDTFYPFIAGSQTINTKNQVSSGHIYRARRVLGQVRVLAPALRRATPLARTFLGLERAEKSLVLIKIRQRLAMLSMFTERLDAESGSRSLFGKNNSQTISVQPFPGETVHA